MRRAFVFLLLLAAPLMAQTRSRTARWEDPNPPAVQVQGYRLYYGTAQGGPYPSKIDVPVGKTEASLTLSPGTYYFVVTAYNAEGESVFSDEASTTILPNVQKQLKLTISVP